MIGGNDGSVLDWVDVFDLSRNKWTVSTSLKIKRDELSVTLGPDGKIYAVGGYGG